MISEIIREADELEHLLLSRGLRKVKDLQSFLWGERGACREQRVLSYPCITNGVHVVQGCAQTRLNFASDGVTGVTDWLRSGLELVVSSK